MTERKPPGVSFDSWVDRQIHEAEQRGDFASLPGFGKPLPGLGRTYDEDWWIKEKMQREGLSVLPPALALRKEAEDVRRAITEAVSERRVRELLDAINEKIDEAVRMPPPGPPLNLGRFDVEKTVGEWRAARAESQGRSV